MTAKAAAAAAAASSATTAAAAAAVATTASRKLAGYDFYRQVLKSAKYIVAPMVDQSEHAWRLLSKRYGAELAYTPMFHARLFSDPASDVYRREQFTTSPEDRPLIVQFCANDPDTLLRAAKLVEDQCDAVDLNLGCPQGIAKRGHYGSFLMEEWDLIASMVKILHENLAVPVTCKIRVYPDVEKTVAYAKMLERAGCQLLTVHGRLREQKGQATGIADWVKIKAVKEAVSIPVFANGNIVYFEDIERCIKATGVEGVMSAEGNLHNPALFADLHPPVWDMASEYLAICREHHAEMSQIRAHLFRIYRTCINEWTEGRDMLTKCSTVADYEAFIAHTREHFRADVESSGWDTSIKSSAIPNNEHGYKELPVWVCQTYFREIIDPAVSGRPAGDLPASRSLSSAPEQKEITEEEKAAAEARRAEIAEQRLLRKQQKRKHKEANRERIEKAGNAKRAKLRCAGCLNVVSSKCTHTLCRTCCLDKMQRAVETLAAQGVSMADVPKGATEHNGVTVACEAHGRGRWPKTASEAETVAA
ncbi:tRNA dihydrouridine synthase [Blastocladiella emersonii ATCC 22665]|nr:tRNA dihydrouridine synthase [Blastocladiella emersonii ATCC 22665]